MTATQPTARDRAWDQVKGLPSFTVDQVADLTGVKRETARGYCRTWELEGKARVSERPFGKPMVYTPSGTVPPIEGYTPTGSPEGNMWTVMRRLRQFSPTDLAAHSNAGGVEVTIDQARVYARALMSAGYLKVRVTAQPGIREAVYQLIGNTGPRPPVVKRVSGVFDPNERSFTPTSPEFRS